MTNRNLVPMMVDRQLEDYPRNGLVCEDCGLPQYDTPSGATCGMHGGAGGVVPPPSVAGERETRLVFCDLETTGLNPTIDVILEIGLKVVSSNLEVVSNAMGTLHSFPGYDFDVIERLRERASSSPPGYPSALELHTASGLLEARERSSGVTLAEVDGIIVEWLKSHGFALRTAVFAGSSIWFDRGFIEMHLPRTHEFAHYRTVDVSSIREMYMRWCDPDFSARWKAQMGGGSKHRVLSDIDSSIGELSFFRERLFR